MSALAGPSTYDEPTSFINSRNGYKAKMKEEEEEEEEEDLFSSLPSPLRLTPSELLSQYSGSVNVLAPLVRCSKLPFRHLCSLYETHITHTPMILAEEFSRSQAARVSDFSSSVNERGVFWMEPRSNSGSSGRGRGLERSYNGNGRIADYKVDQDQEQDQDPEGQNQNTTRSSRRHHDQICQSNGNRNRNRLPHTPRPPTPNAELVSGLLLAQLASPNAPSLADASELMSPYVDGVDINCGCPQKWAYHEGIGCALLRKPELVADMIKTTKDRLGWGWPVSIKIRIDPEES